MTLHGSVGYLVSLLSEISTQNLGHWSNKNQEMRISWHYCWLCSLCLRFCLFVCLMKMKNLILEGSGSVAQNMELQCYTLLFWSCSSSSGKLTLAAYSVTKSWYFSGLIHNITVSYCSMFIFPIHSHISKHADMWSRQFSYHNWHFSWAKRKQIPYPPYFFNFWKTTSNMVNPLFWSFSLLNFSYILSLF